MLTTPYLIALARRPVTPEVAGSSPVGPAKIASLISRHFGGVRVFSGLR